MHRKDLQRQATRKRRARNYKKQQKIEGIHESSLKTYTLVEKEAKEDSQFT